MFYIMRQPANGLRYLRWGRDGEAVQPEKGSGVGNCLKCAQNPQRQVHAVLARFLLLQLFHSKFYTIDLLIRWVFQNHKK